MDSFYSSRRSWLHGLPAGIKLLLLAVMGPLLMGLQEPYAVLLLAVLCGLLYVSLGEATRGVRRLFRSVWLAALLVAGFHAVLGQPLVGLLSLLRLLGAACLGLAVTVSTDTPEWLDLLERLLNPLRPLGLRPERIGLRLALLLRFSGHFFQQWQRLDDAHRVRTGRAGGWRLVAPLTILMLQAARRVADTLQARLGE